MEQGGIMKKLIFFVGLALTGALATESPAAADTECNTTLTGVTVRSLTVPPGGSCFLDHTKVKGDVRVEENGYLEASHSKVTDDVTGRHAQTIFLKEGTTVAGDISAYRTPQVFLFDSRVGDDISVNRSNATVDICGMTVRDNVKVRNSGRDILVGDPLTEGCDGNLVIRGELEVDNSFTDVELVVRGNTILRGDLEVTDNAGPSDKFVQDNDGGDTLECSGNAEPFSASGNVDFERTEGSQCG
jgi:predicted acyltransferase (DUF342 family)